MRTDAAYKAFLEELERQPEALPTAEQQLDQRLEAGKSIISPSIALCMESTDSWFAIQAVLLLTTYGHSPGCQLSSGDDSTAAMRSYNCGASAVCQCSVPGAGAIDDASTRIVTPLMAYMQEKSVPKVCMRANVSMCHHLTVLLPAGSNTHGTRWVATFGGKASSVSTLMLDMSQERERRKVQSRKGAAGSRSLVGSALASISEATEGDGGSRKPVC